MPFTYSHQEKVEMLLIFGECRRNARDAVAVYAARFPDLPHPTEKNFERLVQRLLATGSFKIKKKQVINAPVVNENNEITVLAAVENDPKISSRKISQETGISRGSVLNILHKHKFHPYHISLNQELYGEDFLNRRTFCTWTENQILRDNNFFKYVLFTDECSFRNNGSVNKHNLHYWSVQNPHWARERPTQRQWSLNVWGGIIDGLLIGPFF